jgi:DNA-binding response OmpR family regulator
VRILLVEDDDMLGEAARDGLRQEGYVIDWVRNAKAALAALSTSSFSAQVLDLGLTVTVTLPFTLAHWHIRPAA